MQVKAPLKKLNNKSMNVIKGSEANQTSTIEANPVREAQFLNVISKKSS